MAQSARRWHAGWCQPSSHQEHARSGLLCSLHRLDAAMASVWRCIVCCMKRRCISAVNVMYRRIQHARTVPRPLSPDTAYTAYTAYTLIQPYSVYTIHPYTPSLCTRLAACTRTRTYAPWQAPAARRTRAPLCTPLLPGICIQWLLHCLSLGRDQYN